MTQPLEVLIPVYHRPHEIQRVVNSVRDSQVDVPLVPVIIASEEDGGSHRAAQAEGVELVVLPGRRQPGDYARKINYAARLSSAEWWLLGARDLKFHPWWAEAALAVAQETGAKVIGTNDLGSPRVVSGKHATHPLVHRDWLALGTYDEPNTIYHEGYSHQFVDDELVTTAKLRGLYAAATESHVEHLHPDWGKGERDDIYALGNENFHKDRRIWIRRQREMTRTRPRPWQKP